MTVNLGMPATPAPVLAPRRSTRRINVGKVAVRGGAPVSVQSVTTTKTTDINANFYCKFILTDDFTNQVTIVKKHALTDLAVRS